MIDTMGFEWLKPKEGVLQNLTPQQVRDLSAYIVALASGPPITINHKDGTYTHKWEFDKSAP